MLMRIIITK